MELKNLLNENEDKLFEEFVSIPTLSHAFDRRRFVKYAIVSNANCTGFNRERIRVLRQKGFREREIEEMARVYEWIDDILEVLK